MSSPEHWAPAAREQIERSLEELRRQRDALTPPSDEDPAMGAGDQSDRLEQGDDVQILDRRIDELEQLLIRGPGSAESDAPEGALPDGARVTVRFADGSVETMQVVVSVDEVSDADRAEVLTADSPLARALAGHAVGDVVAYSTPDGMDRAEIRELQLP